MQQRLRMANHWSETRIANVLRPMQEFIHQEQSSGIILLCVTIIALITANSPLAAAYDDFLHSYVGVTFGSIVLKLSVLHWINDGLMVIFFFLVGLEIKREILVGELSNRRHALLPIAAAFGGALVPALIYIMLNGGLPSSRGWGVPMATDIAFALGCLALLGSRVPFSLKIFLTAVAIVDDLIAVLVIAIFYSGSINITALLIGLVLIAVLFLANILGFHQTLIYTLVGIVVWLAFLASGLHATIAGVLVAMTVPARHRINAPTFLQRAHTLLHAFDPPANPSQRMLVDERQQTVILALEDLCEQVQAPLQKMEHALHGWVALLIIPVFAFANAGVVFSIASLSGESFPLLLGIVIGLVLGKPIGILSTTWFMVRLGVADLPPGVSWGHMLGLGLLAGIGFTMALFIASLGLGDGALLNSAKTAILIASVIAGMLGMLLLSRMAKIAQAELDG